MTGFHRCREVKGTKQYRCGLCGLRIRKGAKHWYFAGSWEGGFFTERRHAVCSRIASEAWDQVDWESRGYGEEPEFRKYDLKLPLLRDSQ